ncbi:hypothetical protein EJ08DRAFT_140815 [Tothia fuscella]|uniref:Uncharacterized protein n=1 Tax=Tothia fuscella TaxID=1048955 RepID=A0A9P4NU53_9PEZI|nr:hypothetical protein EJ08DRAFT_140815 [Tothia fuscella]
MVYENCSNFTERLSTKAVPRLPDHKRLWRIMATCRQLYSEAAKFNFEGLIISDNYRGFDKDDFYSLSLSHTRVLPALQKFGALIKHMEVHVKPYYSPKGQSARRDPQGFWVMSFPSIFSEVVKLCAYCPNLVTLRFAALARGHGPAINLVQEAMYEQKTLTWWQKQNEVGDPNDPNWNSWMAGQLWNYHGLVVEELKRFDSEKVMRDLFGYEKGQKVPRCLSIDLVGDDDEDGEWRASYAKANTFIAEKLEKLKVEG